MVDRAGRQSYGGRMSDIPADDRPAPENEESPQETLADVLSPVVDPEFVPSGESAAEPRPNEHDGSTDPGR